MPDNKQALSEFSYSIKETKENPLEQMIEKKGLTAEFTLQQVRDHTEQLRRELGKLNTQKMAHDAQLTILTARHPEYDEIPAENYMSCAAYCQKKMQNAEIDEAIKNTEEAIKDYEDEEKHIVEVLNIQLPVAIDPKDLEEPSEEKSNV